MELVSKLGDSLRTEVKNSVATIKEETRVAITDVGKVASDEAERLLESVRSSIDSKVKALAGRLTDIVKRTTDSIGDDLAKLLEELGESLDGLMDKISSFNNSLQDEFDSLLISTRQSVSE